MRDFGESALEIARLTEEVLVDPGIREWITPKFSTTTATDEAVYAMVMMGAFQKYIRYGAWGECGLPSVTLLGDKSDWEDLERQLETIPYLGEEPKTWYGLLKPICSQIVRTFDEPPATETKEFCNRFSTRMTTTTGWHRRPSHTTTAGSRRSVFRVRTGNANTTSRNTERARTGCSVWTGPSTDRSSRITSPTAG